MAQTAICYKTKKPHYAPGGKCIGDTFLMFQSRKDMDELRKECAKINHDKPDLWYGETIDWNDVDYFFPNEQKHIDTRDCTSYMPGGD